MNYLGGNCPVCNLELTKGQDIVVCPECGAPYHRTCYRENKSCIFVDKHKEGFEYFPAKAKKDVNEKSTKNNAEVNSSSDFESKAEVPEEDSSKNNSPNEQTEYKEAKTEYANPNGIICPKCSTINENINMFCEQCGYPLHKISSNGQNQQAPEQQPFITPMPENMGINLEGEIDGVKKKDLYDFIGPSANIYLLRITQQHVNNTKFSFMISPFFFSPFYFAYRKMWGWAVISTIMALILAVPAFIMVLSQTGAIELTMQPTTLQYITFAADILKILSRIAFGALGLFMYRKHSVQKILALQKNDLRPEEYREELKKQGGTSAVGIIAIIVGMFILSTILAVFFGENFSEFIFGMI